MVMANNPKINYSRYLYLLFVFCMLFSCESKSKKEIKTKKILHGDTKPSGRSIVYNDSITIVINNVNDNDYLALNFVNKNLQSESIEFLNKTNDSSKTVIKKVKRNQYPVVLSYRAFSVINNVSKSYSYMFLFDNKINEIVFDFVKGDLKLINEKDSIYKVEDIRKFYSEILFKNKTKSQKKVLEKNKHYDGLLNDVIKKNKLVKAYSKLEHFNFISQMNPKDSTLFNYLEKLDEPIYSIALKNVLYNFITANKKIIPHRYNDEEKLNPVFADLLSKEVANYIILEYSTKKTKDFDLLNWLKKTRYYIKNKIEIERKLGENLALEQLTVLKKFSLYDSNYYKTELVSILNSKKSKFYLIDFWATWCAPCILNIKTMHGMDLPKELEVINISMDKTIDKDKWIIRSNELSLNNSYLFVENEYNKKVIHDIKLNQLPRYILIDKNFNVLNFNMITPQEGDFLQEIKNSIK